MFPLNLWHRKHTSARTSYTGKKYRSKFSFDGRYFLPVVKNIDQPTKMKRNIHTKHKDEPEKKYECNPK